MADTAFIIFRGFCFKWYCFYVSCGLIHGSTTVIYSVHCIHGGTALIFRRLCPWLYEVISVFVHPEGSSTGEKILQNIKYSCAQVASFQTTMYHMMSIYLIVRIQLSFVQFSLLCYEFCIL